MPKSKVNRLKDICLHIHTHYSDCAHNEMEVQSILETADKLCYKLIAISDHIYDERIKSWIDETRAIIKEYNPSFYAYTSAEAESHIAGKFHVDEKHYSHADFLILSITHSGGWAKCAETIGFSKENAAKYFSDLFLGIGELSNVKVVAHPLRLEHTKYAVNYEFTEDEMRYVYNYFFENAQDNVLSMLKEKDIALEISPNSLGNVREYYLEFYRNALAKGVKIAIGSDAHRLHALEIEPDVYSMLDELAVSVDDIFIPNVKPI